MKKNKADLSTITADDLKKELASRLGTNVPFEYSNNIDTLDLNTALETCNYFTQVISSEDLLKHGMCIGMSRLTNKENSKVIYLCKTNKKGIMQSIPATEDDLKELKTMKFHLVTLGSDSLLPNELSFEGKETIKDVEMGPNLLRDNKIRAILTNAQEQMSKVRKDPNSYKEIYSHDMKSARGYLYNNYEKPKLNIFKRLWYKLTSKFNKPEGIKQLFNDSFKDQNHEVPKFIDKLDFDDKHYTSQGQKLNKANNYEVPEKDFVDPLLENLGLK